MNLHSKICIYTSVCASPFEISKKTNIWVVTRWNLYKDKYSEVYLRTEGVVHNRMGDSAGRCAALIVSNEQSNHKPHLSHCKLLGRSNHQYTLHWIRSYYSIHHCLYSALQKKKKKTMGPRRLASGLKNSIGSYSTTSITRGNNAYTHACSASTPGTHMHALTPLRSSTPSFPVYSAQFKNLTNQGRWRVVEYFL